MIDEAPLRHKAKGLRHKAKDIIATPVQTWASPIARLPDTGAEKGRRVVSRGQEDFSEVTGGRAPSFHDLSMGETAAPSLSRGMRRG